MLTERGDTVTENVLLAAARHAGTTVIRNASPNYMVQDLCFFLAGARGPDRRHRHDDPRRSTACATSTSTSSTPRREDPIEAMSLIAAAVVTDSAITIRRVPIEFLEIELATLEGMGMKYDLTPGVPAANGHTRLVDLTTIPGPLHAPIDKIHPMPFPGLNIDNLPFFALIAAVAEGSTMIHDWVYENRAIYLTELTKVGAKVQLLDPHRVIVEGPTRWRAAEVDVPAGAASRGRRAAGHACRTRHVGAAQRVRHQPRLRGPRRAAQRPRARRSRSSATSEAPPPAPARLLCPALPLEGQGW